MLKPREADIPVLFLVLVVLPIVTYILLGKWNETTKKKARISVLAPLTDEDSLKVETKAYNDVMPSWPSPVFYECARCSAPATTRCSRCKSVRYCSGKCQIIHWRQGHKLECQQWQDRNMDFSAGLPPVIDSVQLRPLLNNSRVYLKTDEEPVYTDGLFDLPINQSTMASDPSLDSAAEEKLSHSDQQGLSKHRRESLKGGGSFACGFDETVCSSVDTELPLMDAPLQHKFGTGNIRPSIENCRNQDRNGPTYTQTPATQRNIVRQCHKQTDDTRNMPKQSSSRGTSASSFSDKIAINEWDVGSEFNSERVGFQEGIASSFVEASDSTVRGRSVYRKPPYILRSTTSLSQNADDRTKSRKCMSQGVDRDSNDRNESKLQWSLNYRRGEDDKFKKIFQSC